MRALIFLFLGLTLLILGCAQQGGEQTPKPISTQTPAPTPTPEQITVSENVSEEIESLEKEFQELEKLLSELDSLENVSFEI